MTRPKRETKTKRKPVRKPRTFKIIYGDDGCEMLAPPKRRKRK